MEIDDAKGRPQEVEERGDSAPREASGSGSMLHPSTSPSLHEDKEGLASPEDGEVRKPGRKRRAQSSCQVCQTSLSNERPYYQVRSTSNHNSSYQMLQMQSYVEDMRSN